MMQEDERMGRRGRERRVYAIGLAVAACAYRLVSYGREKTRGIHLRGSMAGCLRDACEVPAGYLRGVCVKLLLGSLRSAFEDSRPPQYL